MDDSGFLLYKCRRCGKINKRFHVPHGAMALASMIVNDVTPEEWNMVAGKTDICNCGDGNLGISDLIGFEYDENEEH